jgi:uncharacterized membrane protein
LKNCEIISFKLLNMNKNRLEAFSDGVIAIIITIMVLELKIPHGSDWETLKEILPNFLSYVISFVYIAIYWNNHHHLLHTVKQIRGSILWANMHLLFWLSLVPVVTAWAGDNHFTELSVAVYTFILFMAAVSYYILTRAIISVHGKDSVLAEAIGKDFKGTISVIAYAVSIPLSFFFREASITIIVLIAVLWLVPDRRIEKELIDKRQ